MGVGGGGVGGWGGAPAPPPPPPPPPPPAPPRRQRRGRQGHQGRAPETYRPSGTKGFKAQQTSSSLSSLLARPPCILPPPSPRPLWCMRARTWCRSPGSAATCLQARRARSRALVGARGEQEGRANKRVAQAGGAGPEQAAQKQEWQRPLPGDMQAACSRRCVPAAALRSPHARFPPAL